MGFFLLDIYNIYFESITKFGALPMHGGGPKVNCASMEQENNV